VSSEVGGGNTEKPENSGFLDPPKNSLREFPNTHTSMSSRKRSFKQYMPLAEMSTGKLKRLAASFQAKKVTYSKARSLVKETGLVDTPVSGTTTYNFDTTGSIALIPTIAQGTSVRQRVGKKVALKSLQCRGQVAAGATGLVNDCALLIVYDKRPTGVLPAVTDILTTASSASMNNDANAGRFSILKRVDFMLVGSSAVPTERVAESADFFLSLANRPLVFKEAATGAIADIEEGALYIVTVGSAAAGAAAASALISFRTRFIDI